MDRPERDFENLLRSHLSSELDAMRGQAARAFAREVTRPMQRQLRRNVWNRHAARVRHWGAIGLAMAACTALGVVLPRFVSHDTADVAANTSDTTIVTPRYADFERTTELRHVDEGPMQLPDGAPARKLRQQRVESLRYVDPITKEKYEVLIPSERDLLVPSARQ